MNIFKEKVQINAPSKSKFDLSHEKKLSAEMGKLIPILVQETLPGDNFQLNTDLLIRMAPMLAPLFHKIDVYTHFFFVPNRIIWSEWETFITGGSDGLQAPVHPTLTWGNGTLGPQVEKESLADYLGLPWAELATSIQSIQANALPFRAYAEIYNEYYRDENLVPKIAYSKDSGDKIYTHADFIALTQLQTRAWEKDYFTTALPFAQKGNAAGAPVSYTEGLSSTAKIASTGAINPSQTGLVTGLDGHLSANPSGVPTRLETEASVLITELRKAARLQEFLEAAARGGHRLTEWILHVFGVQSSDARIQRPEYLGGGKTPISISEVLSNFQFSGDAEGKPQGNQSGYGIAIGNTHGFSKSIEEHGFIIGIMSIIPKANYFQGYEKMWKRPTRFDYYIPQFAHLGEQPVTTGEVYYDYQAANAQANEDTFGYQSRYAEYKFKLSTIHGEFRDTLQYWHMARRFAGPPALNQTFIECVPTKDIFAVPAENSFFVQIWHDLSALRPLPYFSNPKL
ncbi:MAG: major capsid protein [Microvirus sp.]|nr:MAG: major capsid protein [Microvirus sp.]